MKIRLRNELYQRYSTFSKTGGISVPSAIVYQLNHFYWQYKGDASLISPKDREMIQRNLKKSERGSAPPLTLCLAEPLYKFLQDTAIICDVPLTTAVKNIIEMYRAEVRPSK